MGAEYEIKSGECIESIAARFGLEAEDLLAAQGDDVKDDRAEGLQLVVGETLTIPDLTPKTFSFETNQVHEVTVYIPTVVVGFPLLRRDGSGEPYSLCKYELSVPGIEEPFSGTTEEDGYLEHRLPADAEVISVRVWDTLAKVEDDDDNDGGSDADGGDGGDGGGDDSGSSDEGGEGDGEHEHHDALTSEDDGSVVIPIYLGHLPPIDTDQGVQARLLNLGLDCPLDGDLASEESQAAIKAFQEDMDLEETGEIDDATREALLHVCDGVEAEDEDQDDSDGEPA